MRSCLATPAYRSLSRTVDTDAEALLYPVAKAALRITDDLEGDDLTVLQYAVAAARETVEKETGLALVNQTYVLKLSGWERVIDLGRAPVSSITSVKYFDSAGAEQTLNPTGYSLSQAEGATGKIVVSRSVSLPDVADRVDAIAITFVAGHGTTFDLAPKTAVQAAIILAVHLYENPSLVQIGNIVNEFPRGFQALINGNRVSGWVA